MILALAVSLTVGLVLLRTGSEKALPAQPSAHSQPAAAPEPAALRSVHDLGSAHELASDPSDPTGRAHASTPSGPESAVDTPGTRVVGISGRLVSARGEAISGARVFVALEDRLQGTPLENLDPAKFGWAQRMETRSDERGDFRFDAVLAGRLRLAARSPGRAPHDVVLVLTRARNDVGEIAMQDSVLLAGRVLDRLRHPVSGAALRRLSADATLAVILSDATGDTAATTDEQGAFRIDELASGPWTLMIKAAGHPDRIERGTTKAPGEVVSGLEFVLDDGAEIQGQVVHAPEGTLADLWVTAVPQDEQGSKGRTFPGERSDPAKFLVVPRSARCAADGSFTIAGLTAQTTYRLAARKGEHDALGRVATNWVEARAGERNVQLVYQSQAALVFQAVDAATSQPITEMEVRVGQSFMLPLSDEKGQVRRNFPEGRARFENVFKRPLEAQAELVIEARGYKTLRVGDLRPVAGHHLDLGVLRLDRAPRVRVRVVDGATAKPIERARVALIRPPSNRTDPSTRTPAVEPRSRPGDAAALQEGVTDADGRVELNSLPGESAVLTVSHEAYAPERSALLALDTLGDREETIELKAGGTVLLKVEDALGAAVRGQRIEHGRLLSEGYVNESGPDFASMTNALGELRFEHLSAGQQRFTAATGRASPAHSITVDVIEGGEHKATLVLPERARVTGRVTDGGRPLAGATLRFALSTSLPSSNIEAFTARTNGDGHYMLDDVELGVYRLSVAHPARAMPFECDARIESTVSKFDLYLPRATIEGRVFDEAGAPVRNIQIGVEVEGVPGASGDSFAVSDADGKYALHGVKTAVPLVIVVDAGDYQPLRSEPLSLAVDEVKSGIDLRLARGAALEVVVTNADGRIAAGHRVRATCVADGRVVTATTNAAGRASFRGLRPGAWRVRAEPANETTPSSEAEFDLERDVANTAAVVVR